MKVYGYDAVIYDDDIYCIECLPSCIPFSDERIHPIFAHEEWDNYPICCRCGYEHDYVTLLEKEDEPSTL